MTTQFDNLPSRFSYLHQLLVDHFSLEEIHTLCIDLGIRYDDLGGDGISIKARELLQFLQRTDRLEDLLVRVEQLRPTVAWRAGLPAAPDAQSPYRGLQVFREEDAALFFGRDQLSAVLLDHLRQHRFLAVVGASGSGKSSVVQAAVLPAVRRGEIVVDGGSSADWPIHLITPGDEPLKALAVTFTRDSESVTATKTLLADLQADGDSLDLYLYRQLSDPPFRRVLLVVDQFEELFTQCDDPAERQLFVDNLVKAVTSGQQGRLSLILTLRADFYAFAVQYESLRPLLETRQKIVGAMSQDELRQAIEGPAEQGGWQLQPGLVETMLQDVGREPGALPLLSHALQETWERREGRELTLAGYQAAGGVRKAIATTANAVYTSLNESQQAIARNIFLRLTELGEGTEDTRRRATLPELLPQGEDTAAVQDVLDLLARKRLVTLNEERAAGEAAQNYAEVAHEALIREWPELRAWLAENREGLRIQRQITAAAEEWQTAEDDPGYLYRGGRLTQALEWVAAHGTQLNELEHRFLTASREAAEREEREREAQRQRELLQAQQLAEEQQKRADVEKMRLVEQQKANKRLRFFTFVAVTLAIAAFIAAGFAMYLGQKAGRDSRIAEARALTVEANQWLAQNEVVLGLVKAYQAVSTTYRADGTATDEASVALNDVWNNQARLPKAEFNHDLSVISAVFHPTRELVLTGSEDDSARLWDFAGRQLAQFDHDGPVTSAVFHPTRELVLTSSGYRVLLEDFEGKQLASFWHDSRVTSAVFHLTRELVLTSSYDGSARLWDFEGQQLARFDHGGPVNSAVFHPTRELVLTGSDDGSARLWDFAGQQLARFNHGGAVNSAVFHPTRELVLTGSYDGSARLWDFEGQQLAEFDDGGWVTSAVFYSSALVLTSSRSYSGLYGSVRLWDFEGRQIAQFNYDKPVTSAVFHPTRELVLTGSLDGGVRLWDFAGQQLAEFDNGGRVTSAVFHPTRELVLTSSNNGNARLWDFEGRQLDQFDQGGPVSSGVFHPTRELVLTSSGNRAFLEDFEGQLLAYFWHDSRVTSAVFHPTRELVLTSSYDGSARLWDFEGRQLARFDHDRPVTSVVFHPTRELVLTSSEDDSARLWDFAGRQLAQFDHGGPVTSAVFHPTRELVLTSSEDDSARLWDFAGRQLAQFDHGGPVTSAVFHPTRELVLTSSEDGSARLWDFAGQLLAQFDHGGPATSAVFHPTRELVLTSSSDGRARQWHYFPSLEVMLAEAERELQMVLSREECDQYFVEFDPAFCENWDE